MDEDSTITRILNEVRLPDYVLSTPHTLDSDATGDPAVWVLVVVSNSAPDEAWSAGRVGEVRATLKQAIRESGLERWPYIEFCAQAELDQLRPQAASR